MGKKDESTELEGLRAEDGSQPVNKGVKIVEYSRKDPGLTLHMDMASISFELRRERKTDPKQEQITQDKKTGKVAVLEKTKKESAVSTTTAGKKGGRRK